MTATSGRTAVDRRIAARHSRFGQWRLRPKTVVITHFAPHRGCVATEHQDSDVSPYFVTDLSRLMERQKIDVWCHGHTHTNNDFVAEGGCRVISNQLGSPGERTRTSFGMQIDTGFRSDLVIEL